MIQHTDRWQGANQRYVRNAIASLRQRLTQPGSATAEPEKPPEDSEFEADPPALVQLCQKLGLSSFEREILLLCLGMELDGGWGQLCAQAQNHVQRDFPTLALALTLSEAPDWGALAPDSTLRFWQLVEVGPGNALAVSPLRLDAQIAQYLLGRSSLDERLERLGAVRLTADSLVPSHQALAEQMADSWVQASQEKRVLPVLQLCGSEEEAKQAIAAAACGLLGLGVFAIAADMLPTDPAQIHQIIRLWQREWQLHQRVLVLRCDRLNTSEGSPWVITHLIETLPVPLILTSLDRRQAVRRPLITLEVSQPQPEEQRQVWQQALGDLAPTLNGNIEALVAHFNLSAVAIATTSAQFKLHHAKVAEAESSSKAQAAVLWDACRAQARPRLDELAQRIETLATWEDLVLPDKEKAVLQEIAAHVRQRSKVYEQWGFAAKGKRGLGISALFAGASGTGKTLAAEVLGHALHLDVYRIDLSAVVSKYIGETEKNLRRVFDAAEGGGVILLFDEADALFGKRTEVKDSHDRHANVEVSYLLQRMEAYRGLAILTTNLKGSLDQAFLRRIRFVVQFPFPDVPQRTEIWRRIFPAQVPLHNLDYQKLAQLNVAGGNIRNIALNAAFLAADADEPVAMSHLLQSARNECVKLERPLTDAEVKGWG